MESIKRIVLTLLIGYIFCSCSMAYNSSLTNASETYTYDEIPERLNDNLIKTSNEVKDSLGTTLSQYIVLLFVFVLIVFIIKLFKGWIK